MLIRRSFFAATLTAITSYVEECRLKFSFSSYNACMDDTKKKSRKTTPKVPGRAKLMHLDELVFIRGEVEGLKTKVDGLVGGIEGDPDVKKIHVDGWRKVYAAIAAADSWVNSCLTAHKRMELAIKAGVAHLEEAGKNPLRLQSDKK